MGLVPPAASTLVVRREADDGRLGPAVVRRVPAAVRPARSAPAAGAVVGLRPLVVRVDRRGSIVRRSQGGYQYVFLYYFSSAVVSAV
jgi:hypothetical protein